MPETKWQELKVIIDNHNKLALQCMTSEMFNNMQKIRVSQICYVFIFFHGLST